MFSSRVTVVVSCWTIFSSVSYLNWHISSVLWVLLRPHPIPLVGQVYSIIETPPVLKYLRYALLMSSASCVRSCKTANCSRRLAARLKQSFHARSLFRRSSEEPTRPTAPDLFFATSLIGRPPSCERLGASRTFSPGLCEAKTPSR